jgi:1-acyl-sn-glycerol-3-phosphate acyltransferase
MADATTLAAPPSREAVDAQVLEIVGALALELGGSRAQNAVALQASLEREIGLGSLERVELLLRLETAFGRVLDDHFLQLDTPAALSAALCEIGGQGPTAPAGERGPSLAAARALDLRQATLPQALWQRAQSEPERVHVYLREDDGSERTILYGGLAADARAVAGGLRERRVRRGDTVALMLPTGYDFLAAFQGILLAEAVPVPIYPPLRLDRLEEYAQRQAAILADAGVGLLLTVPRAMPIAELLQRSVPSLREVTTVPELLALGAGWPAPGGADSDLAFLQYTSGSTGAPKGVMLSHANLMANIQAIGAGLGVRPTDVGVSWLPLYHDMGLIGSWLFCLVNGLPFDLQSPLSFLSRPERWLWAVHRRRGTLSAAPNFAYELCVRRIPEAALEGLDLSSWRCALNGAEPVNPATLERFSQRFAPYGFRKEALLPVYGLAENAVALAFPPIDRGPLVDSVSRSAFETERRAAPAPRGDPQALHFVSVGQALPEHEVRIVDDAGHDAAERGVGRLLFRGPSMTAGYFGKPEASAAILQPGGWLDSGDLAYRAAGELYVTGRVKDLIIKAGRNLVPQEIEEIAAGVEGVRRGCVVAVGAPNPATATENLVIVAETRATEPAQRDHIVSAVTQRVADAIGVPPDAVVLVAPGAVPKTSSGKIRRAATRELYLSGKLGRSAGTPLLRRAAVLWGALRAEAGARLRIVVRALYALYLAAVLVPAALVVWLLALLLPAKAIRRLEAAAAGGALRILGCQLRVEGAENMPARGPLLLASNHASYADVPALLALLPRRALFLAKREVLSWPVVGTFVRKRRHLTVDRWDLKSSVADAGRVARVLEEGEAVLVFPEGTFTAATGLRPFRLGAFKTAVETGVPIVPLALRGTRQVLRGGQWLPRPHAIELWIGAPIAPEGDGFRAVVALRDQVAAAIAAHCGEPVLDMVAGGPPRP